MADLGSVLVFLGGLGLFLYGVRTTSDGLQKFAASRLKEIFQSLSGRAYLSLLLGIVVTVAFQSSTATTVLVVEFVNAGFMSLGQALGIVLGSAVGASVSIQILAFQMFDIALGLIFIGFMLLVSTKKWKHFGQAQIGFGIIYVGMANMSNASAPLKNIPEVHAVLVQLGSHSLLAIVVALVLTALVQSSTAVLAIVMSLVAQHLLPFAAVVPLVLGAHAGGTIMTLISSLTAQRRDSKRAAIANTGYKIVGIILIYPFIPYFSQAVQWSTQDLQRQVANAHLFFALFMVVVFLPLNGWIAKVLVRLLPDVPKAEPRLTMRFINQASLEVPAVALKQAFQEIGALGDGIHLEMMARLPEALLDSGDEPANRIARYEKDVDWYYRHISRYLATLSEKGLTDEQIEENLNAQFIVKELEYIGDALMGVVQQIHKLHREDSALTEGDWEDFSELYDKVSANLTQVVAAFKGWDKEQAAQVIREHPDVLRLQRAIQFHSLAQGQMEAGADERSGEKRRYAVLDLVNLFYNIDEHTVNIAQVIMGIA